MHDEDTRLLLAARDGDRVALAAWIRRAQVDVWRFAAASLDPDRADDVTQDVFLRALRALPRFRGDASSRTWLLSIARRAVADDLRGSYRRRALQQRAERFSPDPVEPAADVAARRDLAVALRGLDPDRREAFVLTQVLGLSYAEAAEALDVPVGTVRSRIARAREALARDLAVPRDEAGNA